MYNISNHQSYNTLRVKQIIQEADYWYKHLLVQQENNGLSIRWVHLLHIFATTNCDQTYSQCYSNQAYATNKKIKTVDSINVLFAQYLVRAITLDILANIATVTSRSNKLITNRFEHLSRDNVAEVTVLSLVALSLDRFFVLFKTNLRINSKHKLSIGICIFIWIFSLVFILISLFVSIIVSHIIITLTIFLGLVIITGSHIYLGKNITNMAKLRKNNEIDMKKEKRIKTFLLKLIICFLFCWGPMAIARILVLFDILHPEKDRDILISVYLPSYLSGTLNPILYFIYLHKPMREQVQPVAKVNSNNKKVRTSVINEQSKDIWNDIWNETLQ